MIRSRSRGLYHLHALITLLALPLLFVVIAILAVKFFDRYTHDFINYPLYLIGIFASGFVYFGFFQTLPTFSGRLPLPQVLKITNYQVIVLAFILFGVVFATKDKAISRSFLGAYILMASGMLLLFNAFLPQCLSRLLFRGASLRTCLLVGNQKAAAKMKDWLNEQNSLGLNIVGLVNGSESGGDENDDALPCLGSVENLASIIRAQRANQVVLLETHNDPAWVDSVRRACDREGCCLLLYNPWSDYFDRPLIPVDGGKHAFFAFQEEPLESPLNRVVKRLLDYAIAISVAVCLFPVLALIVKYFHKKQSPGPLFHEQTRSGLNRKNFKILKFRSMHVAGFGGAAGDSERSFPFGKFMRRHSLDEVPQFLNVLLGHMSVVGPRPHMIEHDALFTHYVEIYKQRHFIRPGLTGLAQVNGFRGELTEVDMLRKRIDYDLQYMYEWSLMLDISIILKTFWHMLKPPHSAG